MEQQLEPMAPRDSYLSLGVSSAMFHQPHLPAIDTAALPRQNVGNDEYKTQWPGRPPRSHRTTCRTPLLVRMSVAHSLITTRYSATGDLNLLKLATGARTQSHAFLMAIVIKNNRIQIFFLCQPYFINNVHLIYTYIFTVSVFRTIF